MDNNNLRAFCEDIYDRCKNVELCAIKQWQRWQAIVAERRHSSVIRHAHTVFLALYRRQKKESNRRALSAHRLLRYGFQISAHHFDCLCADAHKEYAVVAERDVVFCSCRVVLMQESAVEAVNCHRSGFGEGDADAVGCCGNRSAVIAGGYALHSAAAFHFLRFRAVGRCLR